MESSYQAQLAERRWRQRWEQLGLGHADPASPKPPYSIALPPPNITGALHMGHALNASLQDALCRFQRMRGYEVCWVPGTDHAAIATQNVIERQLADEGTTKEAIGRDAFAVRVDAWYREYQGRIGEQLRRMGATCDWERERFTLDEAYVRAIRLVFGELYRAGLIYRGPRIVNWCPRCQSAISDEEVDYQEHQDTFYYIRYPLTSGRGELVVATTRPETILADVAVAVAPGDSRYQGFVGQRVREPLRGREIPVIEDAAVDPQLGTGVLKITPGHSAEDFEVGERHRLPLLNVITLDGRVIAPGLPDLDGVAVEAAREVAARRLRESGAMAREEPIVHQVGHCDRCGAVLEPLVTPQWWVRVRALSEPAAEVVADGHIKLHPPQFRQQYLDWMTGLRDWCISRQLWLGHRIPVSTCTNGHTFAWLDLPKACPECRTEALTHDPDVLDTWFSSALWPFAILGWPEATSELARFYPTSVLSTGRDILKLWVARMVMMGLRFPGAVPFRDVLFHATILGSDGARMSKSRGNVVDPLEMVDRYGADAVRAWAASVALGTQDARFDETRIEGYARFANKLWNMTRLLWLASGLGEQAEAKIPAAAEPAQLELADRWILSRLGAVAEKLEASFESFELGTAMEAVYEFAWHEFADWYLELAKPRLDRQDSAALWTARAVLVQVLSLVHPLMPFISEACAERFEGLPASLDLAQWPGSTAAWHDPEAEQGMAACMGVVSGLRRLLLDLGLSTQPGAPRVSVAVEAAGAELAQPEARRYIAALLPVEWVDLDGDHHGASWVAGGTHLRLRAEGVGAGALSQKLQRELEAVVGRRRALEVKLAGPFAHKAPREVVARERAKLDETLRREALLRGVVEL